MNLCDRWARFSLGAYIKGPQKLEVRREDLREFLYAITQYTEITCQRIKKVLIFGDSLSLIEVVYLLERLDGVEGLAKCILTLLWRTWCDNIMTDLLKTDCGFWACT